MLGHEFRRDGLKGSWRIEMKFDFHCVVKTFLISCYLKPLITRLDFSLTFYSPLGSLGISFCTKGWPCGGGGWLMKISMLIWAQGGGGGLRDWILHMTTKTCIKFFPCSECFIRFFVYIALHESFCFLLTSLSPYQKIISVFIPCLDVYRLLRGFYESLSGFCRSSAAKKTFHWLRNDHSFVSGPILCWDLFPFSPFPHCIVESLHLDIVIPLLLRTW